MYKLKKKIKPTRLRIKFWKFKTELSHSASLYRIASCLNVRAWLVWCLNWSQTGLTCLFHLGYYIFLKYIDVLPTAQIQRTEKIQNSAEKTSNEPRKVMKNETTRIPIVSFLLVILINNKTVSIHKYTPPQNFNKHTSKMEQTIDTWNKAQTSNNTRRLGNERSSFLGLVIIAFVSWAEP